MLFSLKAAFKEDYLYISPVKTDKSFIFFAKYWIFLRNYHRSSPSFAYRAGCFLEYPISFKTATSFVNYGFNAGLWSVVR